jgi:plastocyanin
MRRFVLTTVVFLAGVSAAYAGEVEGWLPTFPPPVTLQSVDRYPTGAKPVMPDTFTRLPATVVYLVPEAKTEPQKFEPPKTRPKIVQINRRFVPEVLPVLAGTTVDFPNFDPFFHNVFSYSKPKKFDLGRYPTGQFRSVTFDKPGSVRIFCEVHSDMNCVVLVLENPFFAYAGPDGHFKIPDVPAGNYTLKIWHKSAEWGQRQISVPPDEKLAVDLREGKNR